MATMTNAQARRRLEEAAKKLNAVAMAPMSKTLISRSQFNALIKMSADLQAMAQKIRK